MQSEKDKIPHPLAEVFGFSITDRSNKANRYQNQKLCPFNNKVPNCTKDKSNNPLGVCSLFHNDSPVITCPVRFREDWIIIENAAKFFFEPNDKWTSLTEVRLLDKNQQSAGNIDFVLVSYDEKGNISNFGSLEVQGVYISGNLRNPFETWIQNQDPNFKWKSGYNYPKPDFLSSSRKRLIPQMLYKGGIFKHWGKKQAVAIQKVFFDTLPILPQVGKDEADIAWFLYDLVWSPSINQFHLELAATIYTKFDDALIKISTPEPGDIATFSDLLQNKLDEHLEAIDPESPSLNDIISQ